VATDYGGDLLVSSLLGALPLSRLVIGKSAVDRTQYLTAKIGNLFNLLASTYRTLQAWALHIHPTDNALLVLVPTAEGAPTSQLAYSFATNAWSQYADLPMLSAGAWNGTLFFGTTDGRICRNEGYVDNVGRTDSTSYLPVSWNVLTAFQNLGNSRQKQVREIRPIVLSEQQNPIYQANAKYGFDLEPSIAPNGSTIGAAGTWDVAVWDVDVWSGGYVPSLGLIGTTGLGRDVAIEVQGAANSRTTLVGVDVQFEQGGLL
jgi:hypothetical protein